MKKIILLTLFSIMFHCSYSQTLRGLEYDSFYSGGEKMKQEDYTGAIEEFDKAIKLNPKFTRAYWYKAECKFYLQDYSGAISECNKAISINPDRSGVPYNIRGNSKFKLSDKMGACLDWSKAGELGEIQVYDIIKQYCN